MESLTSLPAYLKASNAPGLAVLEATATWCSQCKAIAPFVTQLQNKYPEARFYNYDTDTTPDIAQELGANAMPTFHVFKDGDLVGSVTGAKGAELEKLVKESYEGRVEDSKNEK
ncbi:hypothetical protein B0A48_03258 [Cryoendolithus antarcticus]|uniref:Thioredoxin domain-containing protein n=1 Tax=Cryoendolithus antarcticus TaxID=1507870 RepID=A0A1V8TJV8_9PEZI|nr:hypothetical protein B0A48_03258 [Cryoendolithus antarcticus]